MSDRERLSFHYWDVFPTVNDSTFVGACQRNLHPSDKAHETP